MAGEPGGTGQGPGGELDSMHGLRERIQELEAQMNVMRDELENKHLEGSASTLREKYQKDFENLKVLPRFNALRFLLLECTGGVPSVPRFAKLRGIPHERQHT